jgi:hypothetical protein
MVAVAITALDLGEIRAMSGSERGIYLIIGALPMANILAVANVIGQQHPGRQPFLHGFAASGMLALAFYGVLLGPTFASFGTHSYVALLMEPILGSYRGRPLVHFPIACLVGVVMLSGPQLAFALIGGVLSRRFGSPND